MWMSHIYSDEWGHSLWGEIELKQYARNGEYPKEGVFYQRLGTNRQDVEYWQMGVALPGHYVDFKPIDGPKLIAVMTGQVHIRVSNGEEKVFAEGDMFFAEDTSGQGHATRFVGHEPCYYLEITTPGGFN